jgi:phosphopantetheine--protein transferase-like protein
MDSIIQTSIGIDSIDLQTFKHITKEVPEVLPKLFNEVELQTLTVSQLCGNFALKEAVFKATKQKTWSPLSISILRDRDGAPLFEINQESRGHIEIHEITASITNVKNMVIGVVLLSTC